MSSHKDYQGYASPEANRHEEDMMRCVAYDSDKHKPCDEEATHNVQYVGSNWVMGGDVQAYCKDHKEIYAGSKEFIIWEMPL